MSNLAPPPQPRHLLCTKVKYGTGLSQYGSLTLDQFFGSSLLHSGAKPKHMCTLMPVTHILIEKYSSCFSKLQKVVEDYSLETCAT